MLRPFTETDVSSTVSGSFLRGLCREDAILPKALLPAFNTALPLTETSWASFPSQVLPAGVFEVKELTLLTVSVVPAGIVAAFAIEAAIQPQITAITELPSFTIIQGWRLSFSRVFRKAARLSRSGWLASAD